MTTVRRLSESTCQGCGGVNPVWFAPNEEWNAVYGIGNPDIHFICPVCFIRDAEAKGIKPPAWRVSAETRAPRVVPVVDGGRTDVIHRALLDYAAPVPDLGWKGCARVTENAEEIAGFIDEFMGDIERGYPIRRPGEPVEQTR